MDQGAIDRSADLPREECCMTMKSAFVQRS
jgi:hypothetical protein